MRSGYLLLTCLLMMLSFRAAGEPIRLHSDNPHYFFFQGRPTILLTSAEHYGAVVNLDFDYVKYLDALEGHGFNYTRIFTGVYREVEGSFGIQRNTLAPAKGRFLTPWARSGEDDVENGGKYDLTQWNEAYFLRLKNFIGEAGRRGVVVEVTLFCPFYPSEDGGENVLWAVSPMNAVNNINGKGTCGSQKVYTLENGDLLGIQEELTRKIVRELNDFDNIIFEICNEPYIGGVTAEWQAHIAGVIAQAEEGLPKRHLIAQNIANIYQKIENPNPLISIFNFHYARPDAVSDNLALGLVIGCDETGFSGTGSDHYRVSAWQFLMAGGGLFNNLDWTFTTQSPEGKDTENKAPGSTTTEIQSQLAILRDFFDTLNFVAMRPASARLALAAPDGVSVHALANEQQVAAYFHAQSDQSGSGKEASLELAEGVWFVEWISPLTGETMQADTVRHGGGVCVLKMPTFVREVALRLKRQ